MKGKLFSHKFKYFSFLALNPYEEFLFADFPLFLFDCLEL